MINSSDALGNSIPQKQTIILTEENFKKIEWTPVYTTWDVAEKYNHGNSLVIGDYTVYSNGGWDHRIAINNESFLFSWDNEEVIKFYPSWVVVAWSSSIILNPHTQWITVDIKDWKAVASDMNERWDIAYISQNAKNLYEIKKTNKAELVDSGTKWEKDILSWETILELEEVIQLSFPSVNSNRFFITEDGKVVVFWKQKADEAFSMFIDWKKVKWASNISDVTEIKIVDDNSIYISYIATNWVPVYSQINLWESVARRWDEDLAITIARNATTRVLERNQGLQEANSGLTTQLWEKESNLDTANEMITQLKKDLGDANNRNDELTRQLSRKIDKVGQLEQMLSLKVGELIQAKSRITWLESMTKSLIIEVRKYIEAKWEGIFGKSISLETRNNMLNTILSHLSEILKQ